MAELRLYHPVKGFTVNQRFGENPQDYAKWGEKGHPGKDYGVANGTPVYPAHEGRVRLAEYDDADGYFIVVRSEKTYDYKGQQVSFETLYCHFTPHSFKVNVGDQVSPDDGKPMALSNNTGASSGPHLHFGLKPVALDGSFVEYGNGYNSAIDPEPYETGTCAQDLVQLVPLYQRLIPLLQALLSSLRK